MITIQSHAKPHSANISDVGFFHIGLSSQQSALRISALAIRIFQQGQLSICTVENRSCAVAHMHTPEIIHGNIQNGIQNTAVHPAVGHHQHSLICTF